jgi:hypothetical protein
VDIARGVVTVIPPAEVIVAGEEAE